MILTDENGKHYTVGKKIGEGGQGAVWRVLSDSRCVIKTLMNPEAKAGGDKSGQGYEEQRIVRDDSVYERYAFKVRSLTALGFLADVERVTLPEAMLEKPFCGYVMRLMDGLESISKQMRHSDEFMRSLRDTNGSIEKKLAVLRGLAESLYKLHGRGLVYCDLSPANIFISEKAKDREVWLIDSDNLVYGNKSKRCVGTPKYQAPEIYRREGANSFYSDIYSFALVAFEYLTGARPFAEEVAEEDCWDFDGGDTDKSDDRAERGEAAYVYENGGSAYGVPLNFVASEEMQKLFYRTFCEKGRAVPRSRPTAGEWYEALDNACNAVCVCPSGHAFLGKECAWCGAAKRKNEDLRIYLLRSETLAADDGGDWEQSPPPPLRDYVFKEKYLYQKENTKSELSVPAKFFACGKGVGGEDLDGVKVTVTDKYIAFPETLSMKARVKLFDCENSAYAVRYKYPAPKFGEKLQILVRADGKGGQADKVITVERLK